MKKWFSSLILPENPGVYTTKYLVNVEFRDNDLREMTYYYFTRRFIDGVWVKENDGYDDDFEWYGEAHYTNTSASLSEKDKFVKFD